MSHSYKHVPPIPKKPIAFGDNGTLTQFLAHRVLHFTPSRLPPYEHPVFGHMVMGMSIAKRVPQGHGRNGEKRANRRTKQQRRDDADIGRMLAEIRDDGKL